MFFGELVRGLRQQHGLKQREFARRTGLPQGKISGIERDRHPNPTQDTLLRLATAFEIPVPDLMQQAVLFLMMDLPTTTCQRYKKSPGLCRT